MTPAELLNAAADRLDKLAYGFAAEDFWRSDVARADLSMGAKAWADVMSPVMAAPLAALLRIEADRAGAGYTGTDSHQPAVTIARNILGETDR